MKINWKVRLTNPVWWVQVILAVFIPIFSYFGYSPDSMTSWELVGQTLFRALQNPYVLGVTAISVINTLNDPTTKGFGDSIDALKYERPK